MEDLSGTRWRTHCPSRLIGKEIKIRLRDDWVEVYS